MRKSLSLVLLLAAGLLARANDGVFYSMGDQLFPIKETVVQLKKEVLNLTRMGSSNLIQVDVYFEFYNPGATRELLVGFVTPPASGDVPEEQGDHPQIKDFKAMVDGNLLPFKVKRLDDSGFKLGEELATGSDFVYHFTVKFKSGITVIRHSYVFHAGSSVDLKCDAYYRLTTGATWANKEIGDFELNVNMGNDVYFSFPYSFNDKPAQWTLLGIGKMMQKPCTQHPYRGEAETKFRMAFIRKGSLQMRATHFVPKKDLSLAIMLLHNEIGFWTEPGLNHPLKDLTVDVLYGEPGPEELAPLSDLQIRMLKNLPYAQKGFDFKTPALKKEFMRYTWYLPDPNYKPGPNESFNFTPEWIKAISEEEKRRKLKNN